MKSVALWSQTALGLKLVALGESQTLPEPQSSWDLGLEPLPPGQAACRVVTTAGAQYLAGEQSTFGSKHRST